MNDEKPGPTNRFASLDAWDQRARPRPPITRHEIVTQSLAVLDDEGLDRLTMRRVADRLGVQAASLYNHVRDKGELLALLADAISGELPAIDPARPWRDQLEQTARDYRRLLQSHRDAARLFAATPPIGPRRVQSIEDLLDVLGRAGFSDDDVADAAFVFNTFVVGFVLDDVQATGEQNVTQSELIEQVRQWFRSLPADRFPRLTALADRLFDPDPDRRFEFGLAVLLDGLELRLHRGTDSLPPRS